MQLSVYACPRRAVASFDRCQARYTPDDARRALSHAETLAPMSEPWPDLTLPGWQDTRDTLHLWTQVVGKVRLALEPMINHWWQVTLYVSARGLTTSLMPAGDRGLEIEFDFVDHVLDLRDTAGEVRRFGLEGLSVADFYTRTLAALDDLRVRVPVRGVPVEVAEAVPFAED